MTYLECDTVFNEQLLVKQARLRLAVTYFDRLVVDSILGRLALSVFPDLCQCHAGITGATVRAALTPISIE